MAGAIRSLIIGGGVRAGTPATLLNFPIFSGTTPPDLLVDGNIRQDSSTPPKVYIGDSTYTAGATVIGGATANVLTGKSIVIGDGASSLNTAGINTNVVIGENAINGLGHGNVVIGDAATAAGSGATAADGVVIGRGANIGASAGGVSCVIVGAGASVQLGSQQVVIGSGASISANNLNVAVGYNVSIAGGAGIANCVVVGPDSGTNQTGNILYGYGMTNNISSRCALIGLSFTAVAGFPANTCGFLASTNGYTTFLIGKGDAVAAPTSLTFRLTNGLGANIAAGSLTIQSGLGTGTGASSVINLASSIPVGAGSTLQTARTGFRMSPSTTAGQTDIMIYDVDNATLERVTVGAADSGGVGFKLLRIPN